MKMYYDYNVAIHVEGNHVCQEKIKYIEIDFCYIHDMVQVGARVSEVQVPHVFINILHLVAFTKCSDKLKYFESNSVWQRKIKYIEVYCCRIHDMVQVGACI